MATQADNTEDTKMNSAPLNCPAAFQGYQAAQEGAKRASNPFTSIPDEFSARWYWFQGFDLGVADLA